MASAGELSSPGSPISQELPVSGARDVRFLPWQDGGVVILKGSFPLEGFLIFAGRDVLQGRSIFNRPDARISPVLPITQQNFNEMVARLQNTNMIVRQEPLNLVSQKLSDEGSSSPFWARLFLGILRLRT